MTRNRWHFFLIGLFLLNTLLTSLSSFGQGCSDAGFCTVGNLAQLRTDSLANKKKLTLLLPIGKGDEGVSVFTPAIQYDHEISSRWAIQAKVTANYAHGNLGSALGLGDLFLSGTRTLLRDGTWRVSFTLGTKLPLNLSNIKMDNKSLPMQYQSSLGTIDLITGLSITNNSWQISAGWQQPLSGINRNNFLPAYWNTDAARKYAPSNDFNRKGDILVRVAYLFALRQDIRINAGLLAIEHLGEDTYIGANASNEPISIKGSQGITLNATVLGTWVVTKNIALGFSAGVPLVVRDVRPDGLTRSFVIMPEIRWTF